MYRRSCTILYIEHGQNQTNSAPENRRKPLRIVNFHRNKNYTVRQLWIGTKWENKNGGVFTRVSKIICTVWLVTNRTCLKRHFRCPVAHVNMDTCQNQFCKVRQRANRTAVTRNWFSVTGVNLDTCHNQWCTERHMVFFTRVTTTFVQYDRRCSCEGSREMVYNVKRVTNRF